MVVKHLDGIRQLLVIYPYVVEGGFTVVSKSPDTGLYDAHFGLVLTQDPKVCEQGYEPTKVRSPQDRQRQADGHDRRTVPSRRRVSNARGAQNAPRAGAAYRAPVVASYDPATGKVDLG